MTVNITENQLKEQNFFMQKVKAVTHTYISMPLAFVHSYGCQQNVSDGEKIKGMLSEMGYQLTDDIKKASFILFNTCAVRENAEDRVFGNVGALKNLKKNNSDLIIAVCGCMVQQQGTAERLKKTFPFVDIIFGTHVLHKFPEMLFTNLMSSERIFEITNSDGCIAEGLPVRRDSRLKASVPIMYGCNNFCTYCVVPYVRGRERSRSPENVYNEVKQLVDEGYKDITLLGQNVNSYGKNSDVGFAELLTRLDNIEGDFRISFMTSHPKDCTKELIDTVANSKKISHHLHLPVQSGSNRILKLMNRCYTREKYIELVNYAKEKIPDIMLSTDIIVGFPGETYDDFSETLDLLRTVNFDSAFTFIYSRRSGTVAAEMEDPVSDEEKGKWFRELLAVQDECGANAYQKYLGRTMRVLCEGKGRVDDKYVTGKSRQNIIVDFDGTDDMIGKFVDVKITKALKWALVGNIVKN